MSTQVKPLAALFKDERIGRELTEAEIRSVGGADLIIDLTAEQEDTDRSDGSVIIDNITFEID